MRRITFWCTVALTVWTVSGCGFNKRVFLCKKVISMNSEICDLMSQVKDTASAEAVKPQLKVLKKRYDDEIKPEEEKLNNEKLTKEQAEEIRQLLVEDYGAMVTRFYAEVSRLQGRPEWNIIGAFAGSKPLDLPLPRNQFPQGLGMGFGGGQRPGG